MEWPALPSYWLYPCAHLSAGRLLWKAAWPSPHHRGDQLQPLLYVQSPTVPRWVTALMEAREETHPHLKYLEQKCHFCLSFNFCFGKTHPGRSFPWRVVLRQCSQSNLKGWDRTAWVCPVQVVVSLLVPLHCFPALSIYFFQTAVLQSDKSLFSVALSRCCSFPFSSSVAYSLIFFSSVWWGKNYIQIQAGPQQIKHSP